MKTLLSFHPNINKNLHNSLNSSSSSSSSLSPSFLSQQNVEIGNSNDDESNILIDDYISISSERIVYPKDSSTVESSKLNTILPISIMIEPDQNNILAKSVLSCNEELKTNKPAHIISSECASYETNKTSLSWAKSFTNSINFLKNRGISKSYPTIKQTNGLKTVSEPNVTVCNSSNLDCKDSKSCMQVNGVENYKTSSTTNNTKPNTKSPWDLLCHLINCKVAFKKQFNGKKYNWIQLAGHAGRFKPGEREGFILKLMDDSERECLEMLKVDTLSPFVPHIDKVLYDKEENNYYTELQDLLYGFQNPSIMDIKIGVRTFLENDSDVKESKARNDLYLKLIEISPNEPTDEEHARKAITKKRYMQWRETASCSATLGFRIEAIKKNKVSEKEFYSVRERKEVLAHFKNYTDHKKYIMNMYVDRLEELNKSLRNSEFFNSHEMIGSSLLFVHDSKKASIWMIDFGKTRSLPSGVKITHSDKWIEGNHEDGYLIGIENLISLFKEAASN